MSPRTDADFIPKSSLGIKPPKHRYANKHIHATYTWLEDKQETDGAEGLWRIHDNLYDLTDFVNKHPGGKDWLELTKGTDITEAFEVHHLSSKPKDLLKGFFVGKAKTKRNVPYTFEENGFYKSLKREVIEVLKTVPNQSRKTTNFFVDSLLILVFTFSVISNSYWNYFLGIISGMLLGMLTTAAHNYMHRRDNFRMYYFQFSLMQVRQWRISHILSHHLHTNTINDLEITDWEPLFQYMAVKKSLRLRYLVYFYLPLMRLMGFHMVFIKKMIPLLKGNFKGCGIDDLVPFSLPLAMYLLSGQGFLATCWMWTFIIMVSSLHFCFVGLSAAHHHPDIFHDGDTPRATKDYDWGLSQLDAVMDRKEITGSHFLVLTNFGDHALHHMFPTIDHGILEHLYPALFKVMDKFNVNLRMVSQVDTILGGCSFSGIWHSGSTLSSKGS